VSDKSAAQHTAPLPARKSQLSSEHDTLRAIDQLFLHDQLEALLASPTLARVAAGHSEDGDEPAEFDSTVFEGDTEPSIDVQLLREVLRAGLK
jgi:hypothetical protein